MARVIRRGAACLGALLVSAAVSQPSGAEMYRCHGADGKTLYTSDPAACPGAKPHRPSGHFERFGNAPPPRPANRTPARSAIDREAAQESMWRARRADALRRREAAEEREAQFRQLVTWCNRGNDLYRTDRMGMRHDVSCDEARSEWKRAESEARELTAYLDGGLEEECRRAGCLPGWIR